MNIAGFTIENATGSYKGGIYLGTGVDHCNVSDNYVSNNDYGIRLYKSSDNTITNNIASSNSKFGIYLYSSSNNILANNSANSNNLDGIRLRSHSNNNTLTNNIANSNSEAGILCWTSSDNILTYNNINLNAYGIWVHNSSCYNILANNSANSNDKHGIRLSSSSNNMIYLNDFMNNGDNIYSYKSGNLFNSTSKIKYIYNGHTYTNQMGNYWSDYNGNDVDKDGIGDTPYSINSDNDEYPLMKPSEYYLPLPQYPDLMVDDIRIEPAEFSPGDEVKLYARIKNIGDADAVGKFWCNRYIDGTFINHWYKNDLAAGDTKRTSKKYTWPDDCKSHTIKVVVDADGNITESNEGNIERSEKFSATPVPTPKHNLPDLEVTAVKAIGIRISLPGSIWPGGKINVDTVNVDFTVKNVGNEPVTEKFYTEIYVYGSNNMERVETTNLAPGESFTESVRLTCPFAHLRLKPVIVIVDADKVIAELDEENNKKESWAFVPNFR